MCNITGIIFGATAFSPQEINGKEVLEVGAIDINGSLRPIIEAMSPEKYIGIDLEDGPGVDFVCDVKNLTKIYGEESFDIIISTEVLEHVDDWRLAINNIKKICRPGGSILLTTRSKGFPYHAHPHDHWRFELEDIRDMFSDFEIERIEQDTRKPGVFVKTRKPEKYIAKDLSNIKLFNMGANRRVPDINSKDYRGIKFRLKVLKFKLMSMLIKVGEAIFIRDN